MTAAEEREGVVRLVGGLASAQVSGDEVLSTHSGSGDAEGFWVNERNSDRLSLWPRRTSGFYLKSHRSKEPSQE